MTITPDLIERHAAAAPRYTSYPTANHFCPAIGVENYAAWLGSVAPGSDVSLYVHIPFCRDLCWYCGCTTKATRRYEPVLEYLDVLEREIGHVATLLPSGARVRHIHWGGGSPTLLAPDDMRRLDTAIRSAFEVDAAAEFAVEIDPRTMDVPRIDMMAAIGVTRASIGVQDFAPEVQAAINRHQDFDTTRRVVDQLRSAGIDSINIDLVYGLPHQTRSSVFHTIESVLRLDPDRIAIFGYAHLPSRIKHQRLIDEAALPDAIERVGQSRRLARVLNNAGYQTIGLDHFALPTDSMGRLVAGKTVAGTDVSGPTATRRHGTGSASLHRNFQGYTTDCAETLIGLGASAIGRFRQGYVQNAVSTDHYAARISATGLATVRGAVLGVDDRVRAAVIERLMCDFEVSLDDIAAAYGTAADPVIETAHDIVDADRDGLVTLDGGLFAVTERGRTFVRTICACFDAYLDTSTTSHAMAV